MNSVTSEILSPKVSTQLPYCANLSFKLSIIFLNSLFNEGTLLIDKMILQMCIFQGSKRKRNDATIMNLQSFCKYQLPVSRDLASNHLMWYFPIGCIDNIGLSVKFPVCAIFFN